MRATILLLAVLVSVSACGGGDAADTVDSPLPGGTAYQVCAGETEPLPQIRARIRVRFALGRLRTREVNLMCADAFSSSFAALSLRELGFRRATDIVGGFSAWKAEGLPVRSAPEPEAADELPAMGGAEPVEGRPQGCDR